MAAPGDTANNQVKGWVPSGVNAFIPPSRSRPFVEGLLQGGEMPLSQADSGSEAQLVSREAT